MRFLLLCPAENAPVQADGRAAQYQVAENEVTIFAALVLLIFARGKHKSNTTLAG